VIWSKVRVDQPTGSAYVVSHSVDAILRPNRLTADQVMKIRQYQDSDQRLFQQLVYQAQEEDCLLDEWMSGAQRMLGDYLTGLFEDLDRNHGAILVLEEDSGGQVLGFVAVLGACGEHDIDEVDHVFGFVTDLVINDAVAGDKADEIMTALLDAAEQHVQSCGSTVMRVSVLAANKSLTDSYRRRQYRERLVQFEKIFKQSEKKI